MDCGAVKMVCPPDGIFDFFKVLTPHLSLQIKIKKEYNVILLKLPFYCYGRVSHFPASFFTKNYADFDRIFLKNLPW